jgi:glycosyltransferase involved in cell wall biosynthesis
MQQDYKKRIEELKLSNDVILNEFTTSPYKIIQESDLVVFPSLYEGFGNILIESILCETPIVSTNYYGIDKNMAELLNEIGLLVELGDVPGMASRINYVFDNYNTVKNNILKIKSIIIDIYSIKKHVKMLENHISKL